MNTKVPAGFYYDVWVAASIDSWTEVIDGKPHTTFYAPTGIPAFADGFTLANATPVFLDK